MPKRTLVLQPTDFVQDAVQKWKVGEVGMNIGKSEKYLFDHVTIRDTGSLLPVVFDIDEGYRRGGLLKSDEGENVALIAVSNIKADEPAMDYKLREDEKATSICGLIIHNKKEAEVLSEFFKFVADEIEKTEGR